MKIENKNIKIVGISLPKDILEKADKKAASLYQNRSEYIKNLILFDLDLANLANCLRPKKELTK